MSDPADELTPALAEAKARYEGRTQPAPASPTAWSPLRAPEAGSPPSPAVTSGDPAVPSGPGRPAGSARAVDEIRREMADESSLWKRPALVKELEAAYKQLHGVPLDAPTADTEPQAALPALAPDAGLSWDTSAVSELRQTAGREGVHPSDVSRGLYLIAEASRSTEKWTAASLEAHLTKKHGAARFEKMDLDAGEALAVMSERHRHDLGRSGLLWHPALFEHLAEVGAKLYDPRTPQGWERLRRKYSK